MTTHTDLVPTGVVPILVTPFDHAERIDPTALVAEVAFLAGHGIRWVSIGFGSEVQRLTHDEIDDVVRTARSVEPRVRVVGNADAASIAGARATIARLHRAGADAMLLRPPAIAGLDDEDLASAFASVAAGSPVPIIVQDAAAMTGVALSPELIIRLLREVTEIRGAKLESKDAPKKITAIRSAVGQDEGILLGGAGGAAFACELARGADGTMPGPAFPEVFRALELAYRRGGQVRARALQAAMLPYLTLGERSMDTFVYGQKFALRRRGVLSNTRLRRPHSAFRDDRLDAELDSLLDDLDRQRWHGDGLETS